MNVNELQTASFSNEKVFLRKDELVLRKILKCAHIVNIIRVPAKYLQNSVEYPLQITDWMNTSPNIFKHIFQDACHPHTLKLEINCLNAFAHFSSEVKDKSPITLIGYCSKLRSKASQRSTDLIKLETRVVNKLDVAEE